MSIFQQLLGGNNSGETENVNAESNDFESVFATNPNFGLDASDILHSQSYSSDDEGDVESNEFTGIGDLGVDFAAPTYLSLSSSSDNYSASSADGSGGGLLGGLI